jgi:hypothetical protein
MIDLDRENIRTHDDIVEDLANSTGKVVVYLKAVGPLEHPDKADEVWDFFEGKCDDNVRHLLMQHGEVYCYFNTAQYARECLLDWFPDKKILDDSEYPLGEEYYIYAYGIGPGSTGVLHN